MKEDAERIEARIREAEAEVSRATAEASRATARTPAQEQEWLREDNLMYGGLIAGGIALVQPLLTTASLDLSARISVVSFSVAIPLLAALLMLGQQATFRHRVAESRVVTIAKAVAQGLAVIGVAAAFWHVEWIAGVGILVSGLVALGVHSVGYMRLLSPEA